jgi:hypothetical protein
LEVLPYAVPLQELEKFYGEHSDAVPESPIIISWIHESSARREMAHGVCEFHDS